MTTDRHIQWWRESRLRCRLAIGVLSVFAANSAASDFATQVVSYIPAPGQFLTNPFFNDPSRALGAPIGNGALDPSNDKTVSLGGFGGSITLRFSPPVADDPRNPWGLDAIVYGNSFWVAGDPTRRFAEAGVIEISRDANANGIADDAWYVIRGSSLPVVPAAASQSQQWDNNPGTPTPPSNTSWYPMPPWFVGWPASYSTTTYRMPAIFETTVLVHPQGAGATVEAHYGYADVSPTMMLGDLDGDGMVDDSQMTPEVFYTAPDNPLEVGITPGSGGGDAFDIAWAVDSVTGASAKLESFDFIRISTGVSRVDVIFGEMSSEVGGVARVRPQPSFFDLTDDGLLNAEDLYRFAHSPIDLTGDAVITPADREMLVRAIRFGEPGDVGVRP